MATAARWIGRAALALALLLVLLILVAWSILRSSLPQLDGELSAFGIEAPVTIERDANGIPTITATTRNDLAFATGYAHAQDRYFQMDLLRRSAAGELAELVGSVALDYDRRLRLHRFRARARAYIEAERGADRDLLEAYASGVNWALETMDLRPFEYWLLRTEPRGWLAEDSLLVGYAMFLDLHDERADRDVQRGFVARIVPPEVFAFLYPEGSRWDAPIMGEARPEPPIPGPELYDLSEYSSTGGGDTRVDDDLPGSNNWAVGGALTATGRAIVANDMHLGLRVPNIYYRARLRYAEPAAADISGVTLPGVPVVVAGSNGHIAWGFTNSYGDWSDAFVVHPGERRGTYLTPDGEQAFVEHREAIVVSDAPNEEIVVRETRWGPVREDIVHPDGEIAVAWTGHHARALNLAQRDLETVQSVRDALAVAATAGIPPQNFVVGDADGNIGWTIIGQVPLRDGYDRELPVDGRRYRGFTGWLEPQVYPRVVNPPSGRIWTANARVADGIALRLIGDGGYDLGARARQIRDGLAARERFAPADMLDIQLDDRALFLARWQALLLELLDDDALAGRPARADYRAAVADWSARAAVDDVGYRLVRNFRLSVQASVFDMLMAPVREAYPHDVPLRISQQFEAPLWALVTTQPPHLLTSNYASWQDLLLAAVDSNIQALATRPGGLNERTWGEANTSAIRHPLSGALPGGSRWLDMAPRPLAGDHDMPRVQARSFGASERFAVSPGDEGSSYLHMPGGQSGHPLSPWYARGHDDWASGRTSDFLPGETQHRLTLTPLP